MGRICRSLYSTYLVLIPYGYCRPSFEFTSCPTLHFDFNFYISQKKFMKKAPPILMNVPRTGSYVPMCGYSSQYCYTIRLRLYPFLSIFFYFTILRECSESKWLLLLINPLLRDFAPYLLSCNPSLTAATVKFSTFFS